MKKTLTIALVLVTCSIIGKSQISQETLQSVTDRGTTTTNALISTSPGSNFLYGDLSLGYTTYQGYKFAVNGGAFINGGLNINGSGNFVGNLTAPTARIGNIKTNQIEITRASGTSSIYGTTDLVLEGDPLYLNAYSSGNINIALGGGNVGIGTPTPSAKLDVNGTGKFSGTVSANSVLANDYIVGTTLRARLSNNDLWDIGTSGNILTFNGYNGSSFNAAATLNRNGNASFSGSLAWGTGTSTAGTIVNTAISGTVLAARQGSSTDFLLANGIGNNVLTVPTGTVNAAFYGNVAAPTAKIGNIKTNQIEITRASGTSSIYGTTDLVLEGDPLYLNAYSSGNISIALGGGNVGIGTPTPREKLSVNGKIRAQEVKVENINWPDYVFTKFYRLPELEETAKHIKEKGHLPGIPSAEEVKNNGIDLGEMNAKLLQKIEELTLHLIKLNERLLKLEKKQP
ncbi:hypothetical protein FBD94_23080 [Pedobacter hiemivivus]|uniref:BZIP transcription factor n=1 Tax=Pedobacter hiemivivus TaxID=2530454 RepID=A0A4U1G167_9SPHI|nr:hypothetical protein [Pedobacter hiemivivus]TKC56599.1 hypothetical protein FBD94_23080 [Pedobacter hiemivivus]